MHGGASLELTLRQLEELSGVPRTTIYYYIRRGLLPRARELTAARGLYCEEHLERLRRIDRMRADGQSLETIAGTLAGERAAAVTDDCRNIRDSQIRRSILEAAARRFAAKGYDGTRVSDIIAEVGIGRQVFYSHFATKLELFVESFELFTEWAVERTEPHADAFPEFLTRQLVRTAAYLSFPEIGPTQIQRLRAESVKLGGEALEAAARTVNNLTEVVARDLVALRSETVPPGLSEQLFSVGMLGFATSVISEVDAPGGCSVADALRALVGLYAAAQAIWTGEFDVQHFLQQYEPIVQRMAECPRTAFDEPAADLEARSSDT